MTEELRLKLEEQQTKVMICLGQELRELRAAKGVSSYRQLAKKVGMSDINYTRMENGKNNPSYRILLSVAAFHNLTVSELINRAEARALKNKVKYK